MSTFQELQAKIQDYFGAYDSEFLDVVKEAFNEIIADVNDRVPNAPHLQDTHTFTCTVGNSEVSSPFNYNHSLVETITLTNEDGKRRPPLIHLTRGEWNNKRYFDLDQGEPRYYNIWNGDLFVAPIPNYAYSGTMDYFKIDLRRTLDSDQVNITYDYSRWERLLLMGVRSRMHEYLQSDTQMINKSQLDYERGLRNFRRWTRRHFYRSPDSSRIRSWKEGYHLVSPRLPRQLRRY